MLRTRLKETDIKMERKWKLLLLLLPVAELVVKKQLWMWHTWNYNIFCLCPVIYSVLLINKLIFWQIYVPLRVSGLSGVKEFAVRGIRDLPLKLDEPRLAFVSGRILSISVTSSYTWVRSTIFCVKCMRSRLVSPGPEVFIWFEHIGYIIKKSLPCDTQHKTLLKIPYWPHHKICLGWEID